MLRVTQVIAHYPPYIGGMELRVKDLSERLADAGYDITVITSDQKTYPHVEVHKNLTVKYLRSIEVLQIPFMPSLLIELLKLPRNTIVHIHIAQPFLPEVVAFICKIRRIPYIAHLRLDVPASTIFGKLSLGTYKKAMLRPVLLGANRVVVLTPDYAELVSKRYGVKTDKVTVIPNATDFTPVAQPKAGLGSTIEVLFVGRLAIQKNIPLLIEGISRFVSGNPKVGVHLTIVGDGMLQDELQKKVKSLGLNAVISFAGPVTGKALEQLYEKADIFILTSSQESFGTVLIEAMAKGLPIIATNIPAVRNIVKDGYNGILTDASPDAIANALSRLASDVALYREFSANNLLEVKQYAWEAVVAQFQSLYENIQHA